MGSLLSRKKLTTIEVLEGLEKDINALESSRKETELRQRRLIASFVFYALLVYFAGVVAGYFYVRPETTSDWTMLALPVVAFPSLVWLLKVAFSAWYHRLLSSNDDALLECREKRRKILDQVPAVSPSLVVAFSSLVWLLKVAFSAWYHRLLSSNDDALLECREKRRKVLDQVKETETYKVAQEILTCFDPTVKLELAAKEREKEQKKVDEIVRLTVTPQLRQRKPHPSDPSPQGVPMPPPPRGTNGFTPRPPPPGQGPRHSTPFHQGPPPFTPGPRLPKPMLPRERTTVDKFVDYLLGDGPNNRYALICSQCRSHNGMCLREEFEFCAFRCAFCGFFNPARAQRPNAPKLPPPTPSLPLKAPATTLTTPDTDPEEEGVAGTGTEQDEVRTESSTEESAVAKSEEDASSQEDKD